jgi:DNA-binding NarL/FixJ family response regulator
MRRPRVMPGGNHRLLLEALARLVETDCDVVGSVPDGRALLETAPVLQLEIVVPLLNRLDAARPMKCRMPGVGLIVLTASEDPDLSAEAFRAGSSGCLLKNSARPRSCSRRFGRWPGSDTASPRWPREGWWTPSPATPGR